MNTINPFVIEYYRLIGTSNKKVGTYKDHPDAQEMDPEKEAQAELRELSNPWLKSKPGSALFIRQLADSIRNIQMDLSLLDKVSYYEIVTNVQMNK